MKRIFVIAVVLFALLIAPAAQGHEFDKSNHLYDPKDIKKHYDSLNLLRAGQLEEAAKTANSIEDFELRWWILYIIATEGYASQGKVDEAVVLMDKVMIIFRKVTNVSEIKFRTEKSMKELRDKKKGVYGPYKYDEFEPYNFEPFFEEISAQFFEEIMIAAVKNGHWEKIFPVFPKFSKPFYRLKAIEKIIIRMADKKTVENFLLHSRMNYKLVHGHNNTFVYNNKDNYKLIIIYMNEVGIKKVFHAFFELTPDQMKLMKRR